MPAFLAKLGAKYKSGNYTKAVAARLPTNSSQWAPKVLLYKSGSASPTCSPTDFSSNCAPSKWNPAGADVVG